MYNTTQVYIHEGNVVLCLRHNHVYNQGAPK